MKKNSGKMRISFDLDEVLFVSPKTHKTEPALKFPFNKIFRERLREGTPELIGRLHELGYEVWVYTSSFRSERYIRTLFWLYHVKFDGVVNGARHVKEVQGTKKDFVSKQPNFYRISLHIDDEERICSMGRQYGYNVLHVEEPDDEWQEKIIAQADIIRKREAK